MLSMLLDSQGLLNENNCDFENGSKSGNRSKVLNQPLSSQTVRDYVNSTKDHYNRNLLSHLHSQTNNLSNRTPKSKFIQQIAASAAPPSSATVAKPSTSLSVAPNRSANTTISPNYSTFSNSNPPTVVSSSSKPFTEDEMKIITEMQV